MTAKTETLSRFEDMKTKAIIVLSSLLIGIGGSQGVGAFNGDNNTQTEDTVCRLQVQNLAQKHDTSERTISEKIDRLDQNMTVVLKEIKDDIREIRNAQRRGR